jgi:hypothetical protein
MNEWWGKEGCHHRNSVSASHWECVLIFKSLPAGGGASRPASHTSEPPTRGTCVKFVQLGALALGQV